MKASKLQTSDETDKRQIALAKAEGDAYGAALKHMTTQEAHGEEMQVGDYLIGYANERAEGMYEKGNGNLIWREPKTSNTHIEIAVRSAYDGRFLPGLCITVTLETKDGRRRQSHRQPLVWHPWLYHYGRNWRVESEGPYRMRVFVEAPLWMMRHDLKNGNKFVENAEAVFEDVMLTLGQKHSI